MEIKKLKEADLKLAYPIIKQLRKHLTLDIYEEIAKTMIAHGYSIACLYNGDEIVAYAGYAEDINLIYGRHFRVYDLIVDEKYRGKDFEKILLHYIEERAYELKLNCIVITSSLRLQDAHDFYEKETEYKKTAFVFKKDLV